MMWLVAHNRHEGANWHDQSEQPVVCKKRYRPVDEALCIKKHLHVNKCYFTQRSLNVLGRATELLGYILHLMSRQTSFFAQKCDSYSLAHLLVGRYFLENTPGVSSLALAVGGLASWLVHKGSSKSKHTKSLPTSRWATQYVSAHPFPTPQCEPDT